METNTETVAPELSMSARFKQGHADLHEQAEHGAIPAAMAGGTIARETYIRLLQTEYHVHLAIDERLAAARATEPRLAELVDEATFMAPHYAEDLRFFDIDPTELSPTAAASQVISTIDEVAGQSPLGLLAFHYVRFGASNGNRYVAKRIRPALGLEQVDSAPGTKHLDPFGKDQRSLWDAFKEKLDAATLSEDDRQMLVETARLVFTSIMSLHQEVAAAHSN